jgi:two-component system nitrogen regulation response regulator GlnG
MAARLFLDEIAYRFANPPLLRVLSDGHYRVWAVIPPKTNVWWTGFATHQNLEQRVKEGGFEDLFHRLNVIRSSPPAPVGAQGRHRHVDSPPQQQSAAMLG